MAVDWSDYGELLNELSTGTTWSAHNSYAGFRAYLDSNYPDLGPDGQKVTKGYQSLLDQLVAEVGEDAAYQQVRIIALAYPDPDPEYQGWVRSYDFADQPVRVPVPELYTAGPDQWAPVADPQDDEQPGGQGAAGQKVLDNDTGLLFDAQHWYTPDGGTVVYLDSTDSNWSYDDDGNWYQRGILSQATGQEPTAAASAAAALTGLTLDPDAGLRYDDKNWYLPDRDVVVYLAPDSPGFAYDDDGNWYDHGKPWTPDHTSTPPTEEAGEAGMMAAEKQVVRPDNLPAEAAALVDEVVLDAFQKTFDALIERGYSPAVAQRAMDQIAPEQIVEALSAGLR